MFFLKSFSLGHKTDLQFVQYEGNSCAGLPCPLKLQQKAVEKKLMWDTVLEAGKQSDHRVLFCLYSDNFSAGSDFPALSLGIAYGICVVTVVVAV